MAGVSYISTTSTWPRFLTFMVLSGGLVELSMGRLVSLSAPSMLIENLRLPRPRVVPGLYRGVVELGGGILALQSNILVLDRRYVDGPFDLVLSKLSVL